MKRTLTAISATLAITSASPINAQTLEVMKLATTAGTIIAAMDECGLTIDLDAMDAWFDKEVPADQGVHFANLVDTFITGQTFNYQGMGEAQKRLHCRAVKAKITDAGWAKQ